MSDPSKVRVTITGADDGVDPNDLTRLCHEFPFLELGILFSRKRTGEPRYPTPEWVSRLTELVPRERLSAHLCGELARELQHGWPTWFADLVPAFGRVQINGFDATLAKTLAHNPLATKVEVILQARTPEQLRDALIFSVATAGEKSALFDPSGGRGILAGAWPWAPKGLRVGYAGGINPDNVKEVLDRVSFVAGPDFWIDMESGVREAGDRFSMGLAITVLNQAEEWMQRSGR